MVETTLLRRILVVTRLASCVVVGPSYDILLSPTVIQTRWVLALLVLMKHKNPPICDPLAPLVPLNGEWKNSVCTLDAVAYTLCQSTNVVGKCCSPGVFIGAAYKLRVHLNFSRIRVKYPLESNIAFTYGLHRMVGLCA